MQKKICMLGATRVGKTSLVQRFVRSIYSEKYHETIGVKIDKKTIVADGWETTLMIWDLQGEDEDFKVRPSFLRGSSGYLLIVDLTRHDTLVTAFSIQQMVAREVGDIPFVVMFNKSDLTNEFDIAESEIEQSIREYDWKIYRTSAKTGNAVEDAFRTLTEMMREKN